MVMYTPGQYMREVIGRLTTLTLYMPGIGNDIRKMSAEARSWLICNRYSTPRTVSVNENGLVVTPLYSVIVPPGAQLAEIRIPYNGPNWLDPASGECVHPLCHRAPDGTLLLGGTLLKIAAPQGGSADVQLYYCG